MKKQLLVIGLAVTTLVMTSCSNDELVTNKAISGTQQTIGFSATTKGVSRSTVVNKASDLGNFAVWGFWGDNTALPENQDIYIGPNVKFTAYPAKGTAYYFNAVAGNAEVGTPPAHKLLAEVINYTSSGWNYASNDVWNWPYREEEANKKYTGDVKLDFFAVSPATLSGVKICGAGDMALAAKTIEYTTPDVNNQIDLCYAAATDQSANGGGTVTLNFKHALSQIMFKAKKDNNMTVEVKDIELCNIGKTGTFTMESTTDAQKKTKPGSWGAVTGSIPTLAGFSSSAAIAIEDTYAGDEAPGKLLTDEGQELLIIPQTTTAWDPENETVATTTGAYVKISCRVARGSQWLIGGVQTDGTTALYADRYFPVSLTWQQGKKYIYTLLFGGVKNADRDDDDDPGDDIGGGDNPGGYDEEGNVQPPTLAIRFSATIDDWDDANQDITF